MTAKELMDKRFHYSAKLAKVVDGDTIDVVVDLGFKLSMHMRLRLARLNAPEVRGEEKKAGLETKRQLKENITKNLIISTHKTGKYGRYVAEVWAGKNDRWVNVNDWLLETGLASPYV